MQREVRGAASKGSVVRSPFQPQANRCRFEPLEGRVLLSAGHGHAHIHLDPLLVKELRQGEGEDEYDVTPVLPGSPDPMAPPLGGTIEAVNFDSNAATAGFYFIPPDNSGAAGPNHVVNVVNCTIQWFTKAGANQNTQRLGKNASTAAGSFFAPMSPATSLFDPKVLYDQYNGRFVVVALEQVDFGAGNPSNGSRILLAVSDDSDPNGTWFYTSINSKLNIGGVDRWADYPGLGLDSQALYVTANMFGFGGGSFGGSRLWVVSKSGLYSGGAPASVNVYDPGAATGIGEPFTMQPAQMFGAAPGSTGTFLVSSNWSSGSTDFLSVIRVDNPLGGATFSNQFVNLGDIDNNSIGLPAAPQLGTGTAIDTGDKRAMNAVWRNNALWATNTIVPSAGANAGQATAHWYRINTTTLASLSLADQGDVGGEDISAGTATYYPSVMVDSAGNMGMSFSASSPTKFAGAYYTGRSASDPAGTVQSTSTLAAGTDFYVRKFGGSKNRWGDYSTISLDPSDSATFWVYNQYATTRGTVISGEDGRWATRYGKFVLSAVQPNGIWTGLGDGVNWTDPANWTNNVVPGPGDNAILNVAANPTINVTGTQSVNSVTSSEALNITGTLNVAAASTFSAAVTLSGSLGGAGDATFSSSLNWSGGTVGGTGSLIIASTGALTVSGAGSRISSKALVINSGGSAAVSAGGGRNLVVPSLTISGAGVLDLADNAMVIDYSGASPAGTIRGYLASGYAGGAWTGAGIRSSTAASTANRGVGFAEATDLSGSFPFNFAGQPVDSTAVLVRYTAYGDTNLDKSVDVVDLGILATNWQASGKRWSQGDFNYDTAVDVIDLGLLATNWQVLVPRPASLAQAGAAVGLPSGALATVQRTARRPLLDELA